ncbi:MAG: metal-dependent hydrolase [Gemmatimonadota bacterium]|jgi:hypothetical protein
MFAVDHAGTALLLKRRYPAVPIAALLISVQAMELAWVGLNYLGVESTTTGPVVRSVADIHLAYMPYSHSVTAALGVAVLTWVVFEFGLRKRQIGRAAGLGIASHLLLDLVTHSPDIVVWPGSASPRLGLGLYSSAPLAAFAVELLYGIACWRVYRGGFGLLALMIVGNVANLSLFSSGVPGPEIFLAGRPLAIVTLVAVEILVTLFLTGLFAGSRAVLLLRGSSDEGEDRALRTFRNAGQSRRTPPRTWTSPCPEGEP